MPGVIEAGALAISMLTNGHSSSAPARNTCDQISNIGGEIKSEMSNIGGEIMSTILKMKCISCNLKTQPHALRSFPEEFYRCIEDLIGYLKKLIKITYSFVEIHENDGKEKCAAFRQTLEIIKMMWTKLKNAAIYHGFLINPTQEFLRKASTMSKSSSELARDLKKFKEDLPLINKLYRTGPPKDSPETLNVSNDISCCEVRIEMAIRELPKDVVSLEERSIETLLKAVKDLTKNAYKSLTCFEVDKDKHEKRYKAMKRTLEIIEQMWKDLFAKPHTYPESLSRETKEFLDKAPKKLKDATKGTDTWSLKLSNDVTKFKTRNPNVVVHFQQLASTSSRR